MKISKRLDVAGITNTEIMSAAGVSRQDVSHYRTGAYSKIGTSARKSISQYLVSIGIRRKPGPRRATVFPRARHSQTVLP